ncbi:MAG: C39 family peptidase [Alphaproteobacteria bacterium]|nr:C39 family peptidase [Alphaproteobacteria bacterium]
MMRAASIGLIVFCSVSVAGLTSARFAEAGEVSIFAGVGGANYSVPVTTVREARFKTVIRQQYDFSCGSAAVATLLSYHYDKQTTEAEVFKAMWAVGNKKKIRREGFSLLDMKRYLEARGYRADGYRVKFDVIEKVGVPAIVLINVRGYRHFVVIKGVRGDQVVVGDPALGVKVYKRAELEAIMASDVVFLIRNRAQVAKANFNKERDWGVQPNAPLRDAMERDGLSIFTTLPSGPGEF